MLTFENAQHLGTPSIMEKLTVSCMTPDLHGRVRSLLFGLNTTGTPIPES